MMKRFAYIGILLVFVPLFLSASIKKNQKNRTAYTSAGSYSFAKLSGDTTKTKKQEQEDKKKIKEVAKAKKQPKPEKVEPPGTSKPKSKRGQRPPGMERPPEIPRRNGN